MFDVEEPPERIREIIRWRVILIIILLRKNGNCGFLDEEEEEEEDSFTFPRISLKRMIYLSFE